MDTPQTGVGSRKAFLISLPMFPLCLLTASGGQKPAGTIETFTLLALWPVYCAAFFMMVRTGKTDRWRAPLFIAASAAFSFSFITHMFATRGAMSISETEMLLGHTPCCHMVIPMLIIPLAFTKTIIFPGTMTGAYASIGTMAALWLAVSLSVGRGWCAWGCFFGGLEDGFSRVFKTPKVLMKINPRIRLFPFAVLLTVALVSAASMYPFYCSWLCPFKAVTEYVQVVSLKTLLQAVVFLSLFLGLVVILPLLSRRRTQCGLFCPFGAFQSFTNKLTPFELRVDPALCVQCGKCERICPVFALDKESLAAGKAGLTCLKCGKCIDECPTGALYFHIKGTERRASETGRLLFLYPAFLLLVALSAGPLRDTMAKLLKLAMTGGF